ncbi:MAG: acyl--CoA ligase [Firmicutes bacterium]|nr:acyl--CoA ligase [Alicyclobacillaceae bacterium]MCL6496241.1 acyl--CoA ligase [Bacillota bacterium]
MIARADYRRPDTAAGDSARLRGRTLWDVFWSTAKTRPALPALIDRRGALTWSALAEAAEALAGRLLGAGIGPGEVVGLYLPNGREFAIAHLALARIGAVTATLHLPYGPRELEALLSAVSARAVVLPARWKGGAPWQNLVEVWPKLPELALALVTGGPHPRHPKASSWGQWIRPSSPPGTIPGVDPDAPLALFFTSGTDSTAPKACLHTHDTLVSNAGWVAEDAGIGAADVICSASPFTHLFGILALHLSWWTGATQVALERFDARTFLACARRFGVTVALAVPTQLWDLVAAVGAEATLARGLRLRELRIAGQWLAPALAAAAHRAFGAGVVVQWGMSELGAGTYTRPEEQGIAAWSSIGRPPRGSEVAVLTRDGAVATAAEAKGELLFRGPSLFFGYYRNPEATDQSYVFHGGQAWFRTGDLAALRRDGRVTFLGRAKAVINRGGMKVSALELEAVLAALPGVEAVAVLPEPDPRLGERAVMVYEGSPALTLDAIQAYLATEGVARYKWPERLVRLERLPRTPTGKLARAALRQHLDADV